MPKLNIDRNAALKRLVHLLRVPGVSRQEAQISRAVEQMLRKLGAKPSQITRDRAHTHFGGQVGNLFARLPGKGRLARAPRRFFSAHVDTVPTCAGVQPVVRGSWIRPKGKTSLGADDRAGVAAILSALAETRAQGSDHPPLTLAFLVAEEVGLWGSRYVDRKIVRECAMGFNLDGAAPTTATVAAPSGCLLDIEISGIASHAGGSPEKGASAATVFALATAELAEGGWLGKIVKGRQEGRANFGVVRGGEATNVTMPHLAVKGEARSHSPAFLKRIVTTAERAFQRAAKKVKNDDGKTTAVRFRVTPNYTAFKLPVRSPVIAEYRRALRQLGAKEAETVAGFGAVDANNLCAKGLPTVTFGAGGRNAHCIGESCYLPDYYLATAVLTELMTGADT